MPKETITCATGSTVSVGWSKPDESVQLTTALAVKVDHPEFDDVYENVPSEQFITLNRAAINRLIRFLRVARDQAFGRDE